MRREYLRGHPPWRRWAGKRFSSECAEAKSPSFDVRPPEEQRAGSVFGAAQGDREPFVVAYCRGPYCVLAVEAVEMLSQRGFCAARLDEGVLEWRARGFAVEEGAGG